MIQKVEQRLALWKSKFLSKAGMAQLIKSILNNLPLYYLSIFKMPAAVAKKLISLQIRLFWNGNLDQFKLLIVK